MPSPEIQQTTFNIQETVNSLTAQAKAEFAKREAAAAIAREKAIREFPLQERKVIRRGGMAIFMMAAVGMLACAFLLGLDLGAALPILFSTVAAVGALMVAAPGLSIKLFKVLDSLWDRVRGRVPQADLGLELARARNPDPAAVPLLLKDAAARPAYGSAAPAPETNVLKQKRLVSSRVADGGLASARAGVRSTPAVEARMAQLARSLPHLKSLTPLVIDGEVVDGHESDSLAEPHRKGPR